MHYYFLDAAGDPGFKLYKGSKPFYVQCLISTQNYQPISNKLMELRSHFKLPLDFEFKYHRNLGKFIRQEFFKQVAMLDFEAYVAVLDKFNSQQTANLARLGGNELTNELIAKLITVASTEVSRFYLKVDEVKHSVVVTKNLRVRISSEFRAEGLSCNFKVTPCASHKEDCLQLADMIAGIVMEGYETKNTGIYKILGNKLSVWEVYKNGNPLARRDNDS